MASNGVQATTAPDQTPAPVAVAPEIASSNLSVLMGEVEVKVDAKVRKATLRLNRVKAVGPVPTPNGRNFYDQEAQKLMLLKTRFDDLAKLLRECIDLENIDYASTGNGNGE